MFSVRYSRSQTCSAFAGYDLGGDIVPEADIGPYVQQAIDQINFVIGDPAKSEPGEFNDTS